MRKIWILTVAVLMTVSAAAFAGGVANGEKAPNFTLPTAAGGQASLSDYEGKVVVLEWVNPDCPFVKRHYAADTMETLAAKYADDDVVWLTINSTHYMDAKANAGFAKDQGLDVPILIDEDGKVGKIYGAKTTPHMFVIDANGVVVYQGAIDDDPRGSKGEGATNYVGAALDETLAGKKVSTAETQPYGCSVKYKS
jgi:peroxiredoxin